MKINGSNLIAGQESRAGQETFRSVDPRTKEPGDVQFHDATQQEVDRAVQAAAQAFDEARQYSAHERAGFLERVADEIEAAGEQLIQTAGMETALGRPRLTGELARTTGQIRAFAALLREGSYVEAVIDSALPERKPAPRPSIRQMLAPLGPVAVFPAGNFPMAFGVVGGDTASAFAAGCPVVVKAHPGHPATSELYGRALNKAVAAAGFPKGFFSMLQGSRTEVGQALVMHPQIEAVGFTGSLGGGRAIYDAAASRPRPIPVYAEMGSVNPIFILPGAIAARSDLAGQLVGSVTLGVGQFCTKPGVVFVLDDDRSRAFVEQAGALMEQQESGVLLYEKIEQGLARMVDRTRSKAAVETLAGGAPAPAACYSYPNTALFTRSEDFRADPELQAEHFGPVVLFVMCAGLDDMLETAKTLEGALTASIHAEESELDAAGRLLPVLQSKAGRLLWNGFPTGVEVVYAMQHGGPYPATTAPRTTSVGMKAVDRFLRPVAFQGFPEALLPEALRDGNPLGIWRIVDGEHKRE